MEKKLTKLRDGVVLVSPEERKAVEAVFSDSITQWRKRKRMFRDIWDAITENSPKDVKEFKVKPLVLSYSCLASSVFIYIGFCRRNLVLNMMRMLA